MSVRAFKKTNKNLQKLLDFLGKNGGCITTKSPGQWWKLILFACNLDEILWDVGVPEGELNHSDNIEEENPNIKYYMFGICQDYNGDMLYDPIFGIKILFDDNKISDTKIIGYRSDTVLGSF